MRILAGLLLIQQMIWHIGSAADIYLAECEPPDYPFQGGYGPIKNSYVPGDVIHYFCNTDTFIGGNYLRVCVDNGDWTGDTPVCDSRALLENEQQSSTEEPSSINDASRAIDRLRNTCTKTKGEEGGATWTAVLARKAREIIRFMLYLPQGDVAYEAIAVKDDGREVSCGTGRRYVPQHDWAFHNCLQPNNTNVVSIKIKSLTSDPLELCEVVVHTLTDPTCADPHTRVSGGRVVLSRKTASLRCNEGYTRRPGSPDRIQCVRTGVWDRSRLMCDPEPDTFIDRRNSNTNSNGK